MLNNCFIYALRRFINEGGYLIIRRSRLTKFWSPHFLWKKHLCEKCDVESYTPVEAKHRWFPPLFFKGKIKKGDQ